MSTVLTAIDDVLRDWREAGGIDALDAQFADFVCRHAARPSVELALAAALVSRASGAGDVCVDLAQHAAQPLTETRIAPALTDWLAALRVSGAFAQAAARAPLVLERTRLYLYRYWRYERAVAAALHARAARPRDDIDETALAAALAQLFPAPSQSDARIELPLDWQKVAAAVIATRSLAIVSGGPGTGKTTTAMRALAALTRASTQPLRIALAAPTGKAAARLQEALRPLRATIGDALPQEAVTLHRLLGTLPGRVHFRHDRAQPLPLDVLVVDEASMIDLALMAKLLDALPPHARLIVLGDKDQLASVEAGAVLHSLCAGPAGRSAPAVAQLARIVGGAPPVAPQAPALADALVLLRERHRFDADSAIAALADAACAGDVDTALRVLGEGSDEGGAEGGDADAVAAQLCWRQQATRAELIGALADHWARLLLEVRAGALPEAVYARLRARGVLCAHRVGAHGAETLNRAVESELRRRGLIDASGEWFAGRPLLVRRNDYATRLYNGDLGVVLADADSGRLGAYFPDASGQLRRHALARLPSCDSAFAITVHQAQGSEFDAVDVVLPDAPSAVLTRELFYTAVTRAMRAVTVWGSAAVVRGALEARVQRASALAERLWQPAMLQAADDDAPREDGSPSAS